mgnify:CR=1 FL=1
MSRGRKKGYSPYYTHVSYEELGDWVGRKAKIPVSKRWLESLMGEDFDKDEEIILDNSETEEYNEDLKPKIEYTLTQL